MSSFIPVIFQLNRLLFQINFVKVEIRSDPVSYLTARSGSESGFSKKSTRSGFESTPSGSATLVIENHWVGFHSGNLVTCLNALDNTDNE